MRGRDQIAATLVVATVFAAPFLIDSAPRWAACVVAAMGVACAAPYIASTRAVSWRTPLLLILAMAAVFTGLQLVPLPLAVMRVLSPGKYRLVIANADALRRAAPTSTPISMDPPATRVELAKMVGYLGFAYAALRLAAHRKYHRILCYAVVGAGAGIAVTAIGHALVGAHALFGIYTPQYMPSPVLLAPILNPNHLAGLMALATPIALGLAVVEEGRRRIVFITAAVITAIVGLLSSSRGGGTALVGGCLLFAGMLLIERRRKRERKGRSRSRRRARGHHGEHAKRGEDDRARSTVVSIVVFGTCVVILIAVLATHGLVEQLAATHTGDLTGEVGKVAAWRATPALIKDHILAGVGRGGFEDAFSRVMPMPDKVFSSVENEYLQAVIDWGVPAAILLGIAFAFMFRRAIRRYRDGPIAAAGLASLCAIAAHNVVDFNLEFAGVAVPALAVAAATTFGPLRRGDRRRRWLRAIGRAGAIAAAAAAIALAASPRGESARAEAAQLDHVSVYSPRALAYALDSFQSHPSDDVLAGYVAKAMLVRHDIRAVAVINRALFLNRGLASLHRLAAVILSVSQRPQQALVEYALAIDLTSKDRLPLIEDLVTRFPKPSDAARGLPTSADSADAILDGLLRLKHPAVAFAYAQRLTKANPKNVDLWQRESQLADTAGKHAIAVIAGHHAYELAPSTVTALAFAKAEVGAGQAADAATLVKGIVNGSSLDPHDPNRVALFLTLAEAQRQLGKLEQAKATLARAMAATAGDPRKEADVHDELAKVDGDLGDTVRAKWEKTIGGALRRH